MTPEAEAESENVDEDATRLPLQDPETPSKPGVGQPAQRSGEIHDADEEDDDEEDSEPTLKYSRLTSSLGPVYRNGDATSGSLVAGDKLILGTHNGNIHVFLIPTFQSLRTYKAHTASITSVSVSPFPPPWPISKPDSATHLSSEPTSSPARHEATRTSGSSSPRPAKSQHAQIPATPSNSIYIATSSIDGNVCVSSLVDPKDVLLRNFARPVQAVALSPEYKSDRTYVSGGLAGQLILTVGGKVGVSSNANTNSTAAAAQGWLGSIGLGSNTGKDTPLHANEGAVSCIKWSLSGRFVLWVNEQGIKIMRSHLKLDSEHLDDAWKRIGHIDKPNRKVWQDMASVWKPRVEWVDADHLEVDEPEQRLSNGSHVSPPSSSRNASDSLARFAQPGSRSKKKRLDKVVIGWGDTAWIVHVRADGTGADKNVGEHVVGSADIVHKLLFDDCIISGISLYTPSLMLVLAYRTRDDDDNPIPSTVDTTPRRGLRHKQNGLQAELRLVEAASGSEIDVDTLTVSRFESLSAVDYHLNTLYVPPITAIGPVQRGAFEAINSAFWDAGATTARLFSSGASILSIPISNEKSRTALSQDSVDAALTPKTQRLHKPNPNAASVGLKVFIQSPYDCVLAVKREPTDHLEWLLQHKKYEDAYELVDSSPHVVGPGISQPTRGSPSFGSPILSPVGDKDQRSLVDFFADDAASQSTQSVAAAQGRANFSAAEKEKRRIGDLWVAQLFEGRDYQAAGKVAGRVLGTSTRWEHWVLAFAEVGQLDYIAPFIPPADIRPPLPGLVYEVVLGHYIAHDRHMFKELLDKWSPPAYDVGSVTSAIEAKLRANEAGEQLDDEDWQILMDGLARLYVAEGRPKHALRCYIRLHSADDAFKLIRDFHLLGDVVDDIPGFFMLRVSKEQMKSASLDELEGAVTEPLTILVDEAYSGVLRPSVVVDKLKHSPSDFQPFLFFYLRALWTGQVRDKSENDEAPPRMRRRGQERLLVEGRVMVEEFGDLAVDMFAEYDRDVLMHFLRNSTGYGYDHASAVCEQRGYIPELVFLLSKTGQTKRALHLITSKMAEPTLAIEFAKEQGDPDLWADLLDYAMDTSDPKPRFIRALLTEAGTSIDPITLIRRIPEGLEIEGLRESIRRLVREFEIQGSISEGVAKVLRSEVATALEALRNGRKRAVKFEVALEGRALPEPTDDAEASASHPKQVATRQKDRSKEAAPQPGHCVSCGLRFSEDEKDTLVGYACGHVYHLSCLLDDIQALPDDVDNPRPPAAAIAAARQIQERLAREREEEADLASASATATRSVGAKTAHARVIGGAVGSSGCLLCRRTGQSRR